jgi:hypothetical protein
MTAKKPESLIFALIGAALVIYGFYELFDGVSGALGGRAGGDRYITMKDAPAEFVINCGLKIGLGLIIFWKNMFSCKE